MPVSHDRISIIIPACNEEDGLRKILPRLVELYRDAEILVAARHQIRRRADE